MSTRLASRFAALKREGRAGLVAYVMASDPDHETCFEILRELPAAGADVIELGFPFTDPMADGPSVQKAGLRALKAGGSLKQTLDLARRFRETNEETPLILMGYANPIESMGYAAFAKAMAASGADGALVVDLPPEEDAPLRASFAANGLSIIRLATPTTDDQRLTKVLDGASGFLYYVSVAGVTGANAATSANSCSPIGAPRRRIARRIAAGGSSLMGGGSPRRTSAIARA